MYQIGTINLQIDYIFLINYIDKISKIPKYQIIHMCIILYEMNSEVIYN